METHLRIREMGIFQESFSKHGWLRNLIAAEEFNEDWKDACKVNKSEDALLPKNPFSHEQMKGAIVLYIIGILYMFYAIAMVCDNYFVPTLDNVIEKYSIAPDVAGGNIHGCGRLGTGTFHLGYWCLHCS
eukprot:TRINITY_DN18137_c0_g1_i1.p1 TRINITY_DN18137_c0_g1~~TRINITY_DN18137_c0_g1_i1.p1  ORF type:complete len:130 (+),score=25.24 TRINITY_DN18137_c0_g1_i1:275-664(+)